MNRPAGAPGDVPDPVRAVRFRALALLGLARRQAPFQDLPPRLLVVDVAEQRLGLLAGGRLHLDLPVSTAAAGIGGAVDSLRTPPGWHRILAKIGEGMPTGTVFRSRVPSGERWTGGVSAEDLILTRVLTLEGLEEGVNRGPGCDSQARTIYLHGTSREDLLGFPVSHGCVRLGNADAVALFDRVEAGDPVLVAEASGAGPGLGRLHFAGLAGSGMAALAAFVAMQGGRVSGSDRAFDRGQQTELRNRLEGLGIVVHPQDGEGVGGDCAALVCSTAVEAEVPDLAEARRRAVPVLHRSELLARLVAGHRTVAVTGTSGKSTTTALVFELLRGAGLDPSLVTGAELVALRDRPHPGSAFAGGSDLLVVEADESDGSLVRYAPAVGVVLNLQKDHKAPEEVLAFFETFAGRVRERLVLGEGEDLSGLRSGALVFGFGAAAGLRAEQVQVGPGGSSFLLEGRRFQVPLPGRHNVENALAALAACRALGVPLEALSAPLATFQGVARRFERVGSARGVQVVDDFAHNPAKVEAALRAAQGGSERVLAVFQPHGYGPLRFLRAELVDAFTRSLRPQDRLWFLDVFFAGGSVVRDISSAEVAAEIAGARHAASREALAGELAAAARPGDLVLVMGARDPSLGDLARAILAALQKPVSGAGAVR